MKIYVSHSRGFDYINELYKPLKESHLPIEFIFPHEAGVKPFNSKDLFQEKGCDYILAEVSLPSTGQGIELGWANVYEIPIICAYRQSSTPAGSLSVISDRIIEYDSTNSLINSLTIELGLHIA